jgi:hypothetical protein
MSKIIRLSWDCKNGQILIYPLKLRGLLQICLLTYHATCIIKFTFINTLCNSALFEPENVNFLNQATHFLQTFLYSVPLYLLSLQISPFSLWLSYQLHLVHMPFFTTRDHDKEGTNLLRISANGLKTDGCIADVYNWFMRRLECGIYFSWCNLENRFGYTKRNSSHNPPPHPFFFNLIIFWQYTVWDSNRFLI